MAKVALYYDGYTGCWPGHEKSVEVEYDRVPIIGESVYVDNATDKLSGRVTGVRHLAKGSHPKGWDAMVWYKTL